MLLYEDVHALQCLWSYASAVAQAGDELAVVDRAAAEGGFGHAGAPAEVRDASQQGAGTGCCDRRFHKPLLVEENHPRSLVGLQPQGVRCNNWDESHNYQAWATDRQSPRIWGDARAWSRRLGAAARPRGRRAPVSPRSRA